MSAALGGQPVVAALATPARLATDAGIAILRGGGTAIDAAIAAAAVLTVVYPTTSLSAAICSL